jgi:hypothetical protein
MMERNHGPAQVLPALALASLLAAAPASAAPGDPLGGNETGCAATTSLGDSCAKKALTLLAKLRIGLNKCHMIQAREAFQAGAGSAEISAAEEACTANRETYFNEKMTALANSGCDAGMLGSVNARAATVLGDESVAGSMDALNASFYCDATSGNEIDPGGDDGGYIPSTLSHYKCSYLVSKAWSNLEWKLKGCHVKLGRSVFTSRPYDESLCEDNGDRSALAKYSAYIGKYITSGLCPACIAGGGGAAIGTSTVSDDNAQLEEVYVCPGP